MQINNANVTNQLYQGLSTMQTVHRLHLSDQRHHYNANLDLRHT